MFAERILRIATANTLPSGSVYCGFVTLLMILKLPTGLEPSLPMQTRYRRTYWPL